MCKTLFRSQGLLLEQLGYCFMWTAICLLTWSNMNISANHCLVFERLFETILFHLGDIIRPCCSQAAHHWNHLEMSAVYLTSYYSVHCELAVCLGWRCLSRPRTDPGSSLHTTQGCLLWSPSTFSPPSATIWRPTYRSWTYNWVSLQNFKTKHYHETPHFLSFSNWSFLISIW